MKIARIAEKNEFESSNDLGRPHRYKVSKITQPIPEL